MHPDTVNGKLFEGTIAGGTPQLFPTKELLTDKARYPRGYTPDRLREVTAATPIVRPNTKADYEHPHRVLQALARSTVPVETLRDTVDKLWVGQERHGPYSHLRGAAGHFDTADFDANRGPQRAIRVATDASDETVIHEYGHAVSHHQGNEHAEYDTPDRRGTEEAYAENYADTHFRDRRGRPASTSRKSEKGTEWTNHFGYDWRDSDQFARAFKAKRTESPAVQADNERKRAETERQMRPKIPGTINHVPGQERFLDRTEFGSRAWDSTSPPRTEWNYVHRYEGDPNLDPVQNEMAEERRKRHG